MLLLLFQVCIVLSLFGSLGLGVTQGSLLVILGNHIWCLGSNSCMGSTTKKVRTFPTVLSLCHHPSANECFYCCCNGKLYLYLASIICQFILPLGNCQSQSLFSSFSNHNIKNEVKFADFMASEPDPGLSAILCVYRGNTLSESFNIRQNFLNFS